jgi:precorrin-2 dehydrogenase/sirohydrochlorin ferrochelatase
VLIDLKLDGKTVLIVGGGKVGERKAENSLEERAKVVIASRDFTPRLKKMGETGRVKLVELDVEKNLPKLRRVMAQSSVVFAACDDRCLNEAVVGEAKKLGVLVCAVDNPSVSDFITPAVARVGDFRIAVSTRGKSPAMARILRKRVEETITPEDLLQVKLQNHVRTRLKGMSLGEDSKRRLLYRIIRDKTVKQLLRRRRLGEAKKRAEEVIKTLRP